MNIKNSFRYPEITNFIHYFLQENEEVQSNFLYGNCYWFAVILKQRFQHQHRCYLCYNQILNHFSLGIDDELFDASGLIGPSYMPHWSDWEDYKIIEPSDSYRVVRDCVLKTTDSQIKESQLRLLQLY